MSGVLQEAWPAAVDCGSPLGSRGAKRQICPDECDCPLETAACCPAWKPGDRSGTEHE